MLIVCGGHRRPGEPPADDRESRIHDWNGKYHESCKDEVGVSVLAEHQDNYNTDITQQQAAAVAQEDAGGIEVVRQESEDRAEQGEAQDNPRAAKCLIGVRIRR